MWDLQADKRTHLVECYSISACQADIWAMLSLFGLDREVDIREFAVRETEELM